MDNNNNTRNSNPNSNERRPQPSFCYILGDEPSTYPFPLTLRRLNQDQGQNVQFRIHQQEPQLANQQPTEMRQPAPYNSPRVGFQNFNIEYPRHSVLRQPVANLFTGRSPPQSAVYYRSNQTVGREIQQPQPQLNLTTPSNGLSSLTLQGVPVRPVPFYIRPNPTNNGNNYNNVQQPGNQRCIHSSATHECPCALGRACMQKRALNHQHTGNSSSGLGSSNAASDYNIYQYRQYLHNAYEAASQLAGGNRREAISQPQVVHGSLLGGDSAGVRQTGRPQQSNSISSMRYPSFPGLHSFGQLNFPSASGTLRPRNSSTRISYFAPQERNPDGLMNIEEIDLTEGPDNRNAAVDMANNSNPTTSRSYSTSSQRPRQEGINEGINGDEVDVDESDEAGGDDEGDDVEMKEKLKIRFTQSFKEGSDGKLKEQDLTVTVSSTEDQLPEHLGEVVTSSISHYLELGGGGHPPTLLRQNIEANHSAATSSGIGGSADSSRRLEGGARFTIAEMGSIRRPDTPDPSAVPNVRLGRFAVTHFNQEEAGTSGGMSSNVHTFNFGEIPTGFAPPPHFSPIGFEGPSPKRQKMEYRCLICGGVRRNPPEAAVGGEQEAERRWRMNGNESQPTPIPADAVNIDDSDADLRIDLSDDEELENIFHQFGVGPKIPKDINKDKKHDGSGK